MSDQPTSDSSPHTQGDLSTSGTDPDPCTCTASCAPRCAGACGCPACGLAFTIFADEAGYLGTKPMTPEQEADALARYQGL